MLAENKFIHPAVMQLLSALPQMSLIFFLATCSAYSSAETQSGTASVVTGNGYVSQIVPFITLRNKTGSENPSDYFGGERNIVRAGYCELSTKSLSSLKPITEKVPFYIPEDIVKLRAISETGIDTFFKEMMSSSNGQHFTLYTHGFNIDFVKGCKRASLFQKSVDLKGRFLFFSWPSDGALLNYTHDEADLYWSVEPLRQTLSDMIGQFGAGDINVVAHSLGTRGVMLALVMMAQTEHSDKPVLNQVVLIAPDIDAGIFKQYLPMIKPLAKNITIYVSANDNPLALSRQVHGYPRLGEPGEHLDGITGVEIIDISGIAMRTPTGHVYHIYQNDVVNDLDQLLNDGKPASQREHLKQTGESYWLLQPLLNDNDTAEN
jgi:esterase/lipase superfamily enzyme